MMIYSGETLNEISFPIGGIGSGSFGIAGNGRFVDWEIFNRPAKGRTLGYSHIAVKAKTKNGEIFVKTLNSDITKDLLGTYDKTNYRGFGYGPDIVTMAGLCHFKNVEFDGEFPISKLTFWDDNFPCKMVLTVFNPFIPLDSKNSSIPAGFFDIEFINTTDEDLECSVFFSVTNPFKNSINTINTINGKNILTLSTDLDKDDIEYGDISVVSDSNNISIQQYWYRGTWHDNCDVYIKEISENDLLNNRNYDTPGDKDTATIQVYETVAANKNKNIKFVLSWNVPNAYNYWRDTKSKPWKNYYATIFNSSADSASYSINNFESLYNRTLAFKNSLFDTTVDKSVIEAISATISVLKTATVLRLEDGSFYGWEGVHELEGSCEGTCQHVWNYAYALSFLFPDLERSIRDNEFQYCMLESGKTVFRMSLPKGSEKLNTRACLDGQMGIVFKTYREWKLSGDTLWLESVWENVKKVLSYAWSSENEDLWDYNKDGVLEGRQHHTLDTELFGASAWLEGMYLCALRAGMEMARFLNDYDAYSEYEKLFKNGYEWTKDNLFNGEYFIQKLDIGDRSIAEKFNCTNDSVEETFHTINYWYDEAKELKYQIADGCAIDQLLGQWHSNILGLGEIFDKKQVKIALESIYKYNYLSMRDVMNTWRIFSINDEKGVIMCSFPKGKPAIPLSYHTETMTGFEYAIAGLMISEGMEEEGLSIIRSIRDRYDGKKRNPWNEIECGSNYARAMASFALLPIYSGLKFDLPNKTIGFNPIHKDNFKSFFSVGTAWGMLSWNNKEIRIDICEGYLDLNTLLIDIDAKKVIADNKSLEFVNNGKISFDDITITKSLVVIL